MCLETTYYHYVVFGYKRDYFRLMFEDAIREQGVEYISNPIEYEEHSVVTKCLYNIHNNDYLNWKWELPCREWWNNKFYTKRISRPICFVFLMDWCIERYVSLFKALRNNYPSCKIVLYLEDLTTSRPNFRYNLLNNFDLVISYDSVESNKYGFQYYPTFMSKTKLEFQPEFQTDVCFWGAEKNRTIIINEVFEYLTNHKVKCDFLVTQVKKNTGLSPFINKSKRDRSYFEYLQAVSNTNCILEIMQNSAVGYTLRTWESLIYNKRLITNNQTIKDASFYSSDCITVFDSVNDINVEQIIDNNVCNHRFDYRTISPVRFIEFLERVLA